MLGTKVKNRIAVVALLYLVFGILWIIVTDHYLVVQLDDPSRVEEVQNYKGIFFVCLSAVLVYVLSISLQGKLLTQTEQIEQIFRHEKIALLVSDQSGTITQCSKNIQSILGYTDQELLGKPLSQIQHQRVEQDTSICDDTGHTDFENEQMMIHNLGFLVPVAVKGSVKRDQSGRVLYCSTVIEDQREVAQSIEEKELQSRFIETTLENLPIGVAVHRTDTGERTLINPRFSEVYGWPEEALTDIDAFFECVYPDPDYRNNIKTRILDDINSGDPNRMEWKGIKITTQSGEERVINAKNIPVPEQHLMISTVQDVTLTYHAEQTLRKSKEELEGLNDELTRSNRELEEFAYIASHDLQEPLRMVSQFTKMLERKFSDKIDEDAARYIQYSVEAAKRMQIMINDLLQYSRVTTASEDVQQIDANELLQRAKDMLSLRIENENGNIVSTPLPMIECVPSLLERLFINLIDNSLKYRGEASPEISISSTTNNGFHIFSFKDNGIGINDDFADKIFVIFQRLHKKEDYSGTGIGLAICKRIIERHGGSIWLENKTDGQTGAHFKFTIPKKVSIHN